jgi:hypothetical protein
MKIETRYGQIYYTDLHPGEMIPDGCGGSIILTKKDIDEYGRLKNNITLSNSCNEYYDNLSKKIEEETNEDVLYLMKMSLTLSAFNTAYENFIKKKEGKQNGSQTKTE